MRAFDRITSKVASLSRLGLARGPTSRVRAAPAHDLTLYEYEASPWCRLVREHLTHLGLSVKIKPTPRQTLRAEGAFSEASRFRGEALAWVQDCGGSGLADGLQFPILVDATDRRCAPVVLTESKTIISHLWANFGDGVDRPRIDEVLSGERIPFVLRFASLAGPSGLRPFPSCGLMRTPSAFDTSAHEPLELHQAEHCPESRLIREKLSTMEIPCVYRNVSTVTPVLTDPNCSTPGNSERMCGSVAALTHIDKKYGLGQPAVSILSPVPSPNLGRCGDFFTGARRAREVGGSEFLPREL